MYFDKEILKLMENETLKKKFLKSIKIPAAAGFSLWVLALPTCFLIYTISKIAGVNFKMLLILSISLEFNNVPVFK